MVFVKNKYGFSERFCPKMREGRNGSDNVRRRRLVERGLPSRCNKVEYEQGKKF